MRTVLALGTLAAALLVLPAAAPPMAAGPTAPVIVMPTQLQWAAVPGMPAGVQMAVVEGDPTKAGHYTIRLKLADGATFKPHFHGGDEAVTVLQGSLVVGLGDTMDMAKSMTLPAGSFAYIPANAHHWAQAKGETVLQLSGMGPMTQTDLKPGSM